MLLRTIVCLCLALLSLPTKADVISIRADEWCPYNCTPNSAKLGFGIDIAKAIFEKAGHTIDYQTLNWKRAIEDTRKGHYTAIVGATKTEVPDFIYPSEATGLFRSGFLTRPGVPFDYKDTASLEDRLLGVIAAYSYEPTIDAYIQKNLRDAKRIDAASGDDALIKNIKKLIAGRLDVVVDDQNVLINKLVETGLETKVDIHSSPKSDQVYLAFAPTNPKAKEYAALYDKGIKELRANGELAKILSTYGVKDWANAPVETVPQRAMPKASSRQ